MSQEKQLSWHTRVGVGGVHHVGAHNPPCIMCILYALFPRVGVGGVHHLGAHNLPFYMHSMRCFHVSECTAGLTVTESVPTALLVLYTYSMPPSARSTIIPPCTVRIPCRPVHSSRCVPVHSLRCACTLCAQQGARASGLRRVGRKWHHHLTSTPPAWICLGWRLSPWPSPQDPTSCL